MFDTLQERLTGIFDKLTGRGVLSEKDVDAAMREVRRALIEADVALPVVRSFVEQVREKAIGQEVIRSVQPGQMVIKIVHDALVETLGTHEPLRVEGEPPNVVLMVGLQGSGKTTTSAKIAKWLKENARKKVLLASLDVYRPAAREQLETLAKQAGVDSLPIIAEENNPVDIAQRALKEARTGGYDVLILDTAGRLHIDEELMDEVKAVRAVAEPSETLLVADALTGQDAVNLAKSFDEAVGITGIVLTRADGDGRGGAALSMRAVTGKPIKLIGVGEKLDDIEAFHPERIADRILGMGDVVSLVEKAAKTIDEEKARKIAERMKKGAFTLDDLAEQLRQMQKLGGMQSILSMLPGMGKIKKQLAGIDLDDLVLKRQLAIISSMTKKERLAPKIINASRKRRIAAGSGTSVQDVNRLLKMHKQMAAMMKKMGKGGGLLGRMFGAKGGPDAAELEKLQAELANVDPATLPPELRDMAKAAQAASGKGEADGGALPGAGGMPGLGGGLPGLGGGLPGLGGGLPGLPGGLPGLRGGRGKGKGRKRR